MEQPKKQFWQYATSDVGAPTYRERPAHSLYQERVRGAIGALVAGLLPENWLPFTWRDFASRFIGPRAPTAGWQSPYDLDASERITRFGAWPSSQREFPYPYIIGAVDGFMPMQDFLSLSWAWGKEPDGPGVLTPIPVPWQTTYPNLQKKSG